MNFHLVVVQAFGLYDKGARITDPSDIATILSSDHSGHVVRVSVASMNPAQEA